MDMAQPAAFFKNHATIPAPPLIQKRRKITPIKDRILLVLMGVWVSCAVWPQMFDSTFSKGFFPLSPTVALLIMALMLRPKTTGFKLGMLYLIMAICSMFANIGLPSSDIFLVNMVVKIFWSFAVMFLCTLMARPGIFRIVLILMILLMVAQAIYYSYYILTFNLPVDKIDKFSNGRTNRNGLALTVCVCIPFLLQALMLNRNVIYKIVLGGLVLLILYYLFLLGSRSGWIVFSVTVVAYFFLGQGFRKGVIRYLYGLTILGGIVFVADKLYDARSQDVFKHLGLDKRISTLDRLDQDKSIIVRNELREKAIAIWQEYPIFGCGIGNFRFFEMDEFKASAGYNAHNFYYFVLAESGLVGFIGLGILLFSLLRRSLIIWRSKIAYGRAICFSFGAFLLMLYTQDAFANLFLLVTCLVYASTRVQNKMILAVDWKNVET